MAYGTLRADILEWSDGTQILGGNVPFDNSTAVSDITLQVGQSCYIDFSSATSIPLYVACANNQQYEIVYISNNYTPASGTGNPQLQPNNTTYSSAFTGATIYQSGGTAAALASGTNNAFYISVGQHTINAIIRVTTNTLYKNCISVYQSKNTTGNYQDGVYTNAWNDTTTAWTSLGTITQLYVDTGRIYVKRTA